VSILADIRFAIRMLGASRGFTAVAVLCLALGIGANSAIFTLVERTLFHVLPYDDPDELVVVESSIPGRGVEHYKLSPLETKDLAAQSDLLDGVSGFAYIDANMIFHPGEKPRNLGALIITWNSLRMLGIEPVIGRDFLEKESIVGNERHIILTYDLWQREYRGDPHVLGQKIDIDTEPHEIVGVLPAGVRFPMRPDVDVLAPYAQREWNLKERGWRSFHIIGRMKPDASVADLRSELDGIAATWREQYPKDYPDRYQYSLDAVSLGDKLYGSVRPAMLALLAAVALVLLIACANVASLLLARGMTREREFAVRAALGASRRRLVMQLFTESLVLSFLGAAGGLLGALWGTDLLTSFYPDNLPDLGVIRVGGPVLAFTVGVSVLTGLIAGLMPALQSSHVDLQGALKDGGVRATVGRRGRRVRSALVAAETGLALVLLIGAALMLRSLGEIRTADLGFRTEHLVTMKLKLPWVKLMEDEPRKQAVGAILKRLDELPGHPQVAAATTAPLDMEGERFPLEVEGYEGKPPAVEMYMVTDNYFEVMGISLVEGEPFSNEDCSPKKEPLIVDEALREYFPEGESMLDKRVRSVGGEAWHLIQGVVGHVKARGAASGQRPLVYAPFMNKTSLQMTLLVRTDRPAAEIAATVEAAVQELQPTTAIFDVETMGERVDESMALHRFATLLLGLFALLALLLASIGIYAVMAFAVAQRQKEIGIRLALGARPSQVIRLLVRQGSGLAVAGVVLGLLVAAALGSYMEPLLYHVSPYDPLIYALCALAVAVPSCLACFLAARRAARIDPMDALRNE